MSKIGDTISADQFNKMYPVGTTLSAQDFNNRYGNGQQGGLTNQANSWLNQSGIGNVPILGGVIKGIVDPVTDWGDAFDQQVQEVKSMAKTDPTSAFNMVRNNMGTGNPVLDLIQNKGMARQSLPVALDIASLVAAPGMAKGAGELISNIPQAVGLLTKGGTYKAIKGVAEKATQEGVNIRWNEIQNEIRQAVTDRLGATKEVRKALNSLLAEKTPAQMGEPSLNPNDLLQWRQQISARGAGKGVLQNFFKGSDIEDKVNSVARNIISKNLKGLVPDISTPDKVYSFYSKIHGDAPTWAKRAIAGTIADQVLGKKLGGVPRDVVDALGAVLAGGI